LEGPRGGESTACAVLDKVVDEGCRPAYKPGPFGSEWNWLGGRALWWVFLGSLCRLLGGVLLFDICGEAIGRDARAARAWASGLRGLGFGAWRWVFRGSWRILFDERSDAKRSARDPQIMDLVPGLRLRGEGMNMRV
jgi:hypothetical protein